MHLLASWLDHQEAHPGLSPTLVQGLDRYESYRNNWLHSIYTILSTRILDWKWINRLHT